MITAKEFKAGFLKNQTMGDADKQIAMLDPQVAKKLYKALKMVDEYVGLDMRSVYYMQEIGFSFELGCHGGRHL